MPPDKKQNRSYSIEPYNPGWVLEFEKIKDFLRRVFGDKAVAIEHVGSTAIPGIKSKPLIDVLVVVLKMEPFEKEKEAMIEAGYEWGADYIAPNTLIFVDAARKTQNIHVCEENSPKARQFLESRDFLRTHPEWAEKYSVVKEKLYSQFPDDYIAYRKGKQDFFRELEAQIEAWKK